MSLKFWCKTWLYRTVPGGYGYYRRLHRYQDPDYRTQATLPPVVRKYLEPAGWNPEPDEGVTYRPYPAYAEYVAHQREKLGMLLKLHGGFSNAVVSAYRRRFYRRFRHLNKLLPPDAVIVCLGARQGTEVEVLRDLGFRRAYGIDLNPAPDNPWVRPGDFMHMAEASGSVDLIYSNCVDHAFSLPDFFAEHARVLKPDGYALYDLSQTSVVTGKVDAFGAAMWEYETDVLRVLFQSFAQVIRAEREPEWTWFLLQGKRRPAALPRGSEAVPA
jgi:hypothetical protein